MIHVQGPKRLFSPVSILVLVDLACEYDLEIKDIFGMEKYIINHPDFFDNRITKS